ncbi:MAG: rhodanese-like domain-containing protein [Candidatus Binatales bacterium]
MSNLSSNTSMASAPDLTQGRTEPARPVYLGDLGRVVLVGLLALVAGQILNRFRSHPLPIVYQSPEQRLAAELTKLINAPPFQASDLQTIGLSEFRPIVDGSSALIVDARSAPFYELGHVPGAINLARDDFAHDYQALSKKLQTSRDRPTIVYCSGGECHDSKLVASALLSLGFSNVRVFTGGWEEWTRANLPVAKD